MIAYFVHDSEKDEDHIIIPDMGCGVSADPERFEKFISVSPVFAEWSGDACGDVAPEAFGTVVATRKEDGDVCILNENLWRRRMEFYMSGAKR